MKFKIFLFLVIVSNPIHANEFWGLEAWMNSIRTPDFDQINDVKKRKDSFFAYLLPEIQRQNSKIIEIRNNIKSAKIDAPTLSKLKRYYRLDAKATDTELLDAIDIVPTSLILAQAAYESDWGRSRFAKYYHNFFGLWCFTNGCGVIPLRRDIDATHEVAKFSSLSKGIEYYLLSINRNPAYSILRKIRKHKRDNNQTITGIGLSEGLENYAEIGYDYVETVQAIIRQNNLEQYDYKI